MSDNKDNSKPITSTQNAETNPRETSLHSRRTFMKASAGTLLAAGAASQLAGCAVSSSATAAEGDDLPGCLSERNTISAEDMLARYRHAAYLEQNVDTKNLAFNTTVYPHWIDETDSFWYQRDTGPDTHEYRMVDAARKGNAIAFDHSALARSLSRVSGEIVNADKLPLAELDIRLRPRTVTFTAFGKQWLYDDNSQRCTEQQAYPDNWAISPNDRYAVFVQDHNLWLKDLKTGRERALTEDGGPFRRYASTPTVNGRPQRITLEALWSPDSKRVFTQVIDTREVEIAPPVVEHVPADGSLRPRIIEPDRRVGWPGDEDVESYQYLAIDVVTGNTQWADYPLVPVFYPPYKGCFTAHQGWWHKDSRRAYFFHLERSGQVGRLIEFDTHTGGTKVLIEETSAQVLTYIPTSHMKMLSYPLIESDELIWFSDISGRAHLYLYDLRTGRLKNAITKGDWLVRNVLHVDAKRRELFIQTADRIKGRNPYYCDICRVHIDTGELTPVVSTDHEYAACDQRSRISRDMGAKGVSETGNYLVTTRSRVDQVPVSLLLDRDGTTLMELETADVSGLPQGWQWPEPVMLKAADGKTDIYGVVFRPTHFDPDKRYPVIDCSYGYCSPVGSFTNNHNGKMYLYPAVYAELGCIAVVIFGRGNDGLRDIDFATYQDPRLPINPRFPIKYYKNDCIAGIKQLTQRYPYMDSDRVGVVEFASIPTALSGLLVYPEFYKVGVTLNPKADLRMIPSDKGAPGCDDYSQLADFADNLRGKLLLTHGMNDKLTPVAVTFRVVEALQKANKRFDMLLMPNLGHSFSHYVTLRGWDYFVEHLLGAEPPVDLDRVDDADDSE